MKNILLAFAIMLASTAAHAATFTYECSPESGNATDQTIKIEGNQLFVTTSDSLNGMKFDANYDDSYRPRNGAKKVRFTGSEDGNGRSVILYSLMLDGTRMGYVQIQGTEDGYWSAEYKCLLK